nr:acyl-CoA dehydrogenase family protein [Nocardia sp. BMG111209]
MRRPVESALLAEAGVFTLPAATEYGGLAQSVVTTMGVLEELGFACRDGGLVFSACTQLASSVIPVNRFGKPALKATVLPALCDGSMIGAHAISEPAAGSDAMAMTTTATVRDEQVVLNGTKAFVSNGPIADIVVVYAKAEDGGLTAVVVPTDTPGVVRGRPIEKMGLRTSPLCELFLDDVRVPAHNVLSSPGNGYFVLDYVMKREILFSFVANVGEIRRRIDDVTEYTCGHSQFGQPLSTFQAVSHQIVEMRMNHDTARKWLYDTAVRLMNNRDITTDIAFSKIIASEAAVSSAHTAVRLLGGYGYMREYGIEKDLRNAVAGTIYSGSTEVQKNKLASLLNLT